MLRIETSSLQGYSLLSMQEQQRMHRHIETRVGTVDMGAYE
jgi:hypothetical protein